MRSFAHKHLADVASDLALACAVAALTACSAVGTYGGNQATSETPGKPPADEPSSKEDSSRRRQETQSENATSGQTSTEVQPEGNIEQEITEDDERPEAPINITGVYLTCSTPYGPSADTVAFDCRVERDGEMVDDDRLLSRSTWKFKSPKPELVPRADPASDAAWHASYVFVGRATLAEEDLRDSLVLVEVATGDADIREISVAYRPECKSHKPESAVCVVSPTASVRPPQAASYRAEGDHLLLRWTAVTAPAVATLVIRSEPGTRNVVFRPVDGQRYSPGIMYGKELITYAGSQTSLQDRGAVYGNDYAYVMYHHDENFVYSDGLQIWFNYTPTAAGSGSLNP
jgi:hypothetical protein